MWRRKRVKNCYFERCLKILLVRNFQVLLIISFANRTLLFPFVRAWFSMEVAIWNSTLVKEELIKNSFVFILGSDMLFSEALKLCHNYGFSPWLYLFSSASSVKLSFIKISSEIFILYSKNHLIVFVGLLLVRKYSKFLTLSYLDFQTAIFPYLENRFLSPRSQSPIFW